MKICAITTYYNFNKSVNRLENYLIFAKNIPFFLITVEIATKHEDYELNTNCADIYIRTTSKDLMWHKESLLNIAQRNIPKEFIYIVWVDCDIIFNNKSLETEICTKMESYNLVQLFSKMYDMTPLDSIPPTETNSISGYGITYLTEKNEIFENSLKPKDTMDMRKTLFGLAWVSHKSIIQKHGFYDLCIIGSGDRALYCAASGQYNVTKTNLFLNDIRYNHYLKWAKKFNKAIENKIGYIDGLIIHLFHGEIKDRQYKERHIEFNKLDFNPIRDIKRLKDGALEWKNGSESYSDFFQKYFTKRNEF